MNHQLSSALGFAVAVVAVWWFCSWRLRDRRVISSAEFIQRCKRLRLGLK